MDGESRMWFWRMKRMMGWGGAGVRVWEGEGRGIGGRWRGAMGWDMIIMHLKTNHRITALRYPNSNSWSISVFDLLSSADMSTLGPAPSNSNPPCCCRLPHLAGLLISLLGEAEMSGR